MVVKTYSEHLEIEINEILMKQYYMYIIKGVSTRSPPPLFGLIGDENTYKEVIRAHKKFGQKRTNRYKAMVKNPKKYFYYGF